ncbi:uncharacterized protein LOC120113223 [Phoenix dactylifera]|nr:uncharacterized protein LOC120113223 [Phoenix dactylifera]
MIEMEPSRKTNPAKRDIGWSYGRRLGSEGQRHQFQCKFCDKVFKGGGVTRLKQHLAGNSGEVATCRNCPNEIRVLMRQNLAEAKEAKEMASKKRAEVDCQAAEPPSYHSREPEEVEDLDEEEADIQAAMHASLDDQWQ